MSRKFGRRLTVAEQRAIDRALVGESATFGFFCDRCGHRFSANKISRECGPCLYAMYPQRVILGQPDGAVPNLVGFGRPTPLIKTPGVAS